MTQRLNTPTLSSKYAEVARELTQLMLQAEQSESRSDYFYYLREADRLRSLLKASPVSSSANYPKARLAMR